MLIKLRGSIIHPRGLWWSSQYPVQPEGLCRGAEVFFTEVSVTVITYMCIKDFSKVIDHGFSEFAVHIIHLQAC